MTTQAQDDPNASKASTPWHEGGCHCGAVRFRIRLQARRAIACNCSICAMKGFVNVIVA